MKTTILRKKRIALFLAAILISLSVLPQESRNLAQMLGYPADAKLLIIHCDDMGLSHSVNTAFIKAIENKAITCGSIMVPCPWAPEIEQYVKDHPGVDAGIHLTLTAEWDLFKWGGISPSDQIPSLLDTYGHFFASVGLLGKSAVAAEAEKEIYAQIDRAVAMGVHPTHIDTHMGSVLANPELVKIYLSLSAKYNLPILFPRAYLNMLPPEAAKALGSEIFLLDNLFMLEPNMIKGNWIDPYRKALGEMKPGLNEIIVHLAVDNEEMQAVCTVHKDYGSKWRQDDLDMVMSKEFKDLIKQNNLILIGWGQIKDVMNKNAGVSGTK